MELVGRNVDLLVVLIEREVAGRVKGEKELSAVVFDYKGLLPGVCPDLVVGELIEDGQRDVVDPEHLFDTSK